MDTHLPNMAYRSKAETDTEKSGVRTAFYRGKNLGLLEST